MTMSDRLKIQQAAAHELPLLVSHLKRLMPESGRNGDPFFSPSDGWIHVDSEFIRAKEAAFSRAPNESGWARTFLLVTEEGEVAGHADLFHASSQSSVHRATLGMGIERRFRSQGYGRELLETAITFARTISTLSWIDLYAFEENKGAIRLYENHGFIAVGRCEDAFRVRGQSVTDIRMVLKL